ncbi:hypothetical protein NK8_53270 (plasmid) [Caballeronia sp. NK8]|nr:hypothetical protein NK8_53270 [Caballeronia sp. NK8]
MRPEDRVALCMERGIGMVVALMAILKAGGAYVPLDPAYPGERLSHILTDATPRLLLADTAGREALGDTGSLTVLDPDASLDDALSQDDPQTAVAPHHLAYVIYTSGSTGIPKGVMVAHNHVANLHHALQSTVFAHCAANSGVSLNASIAFDSSLKSLSSLLAGHRLIVIPADVRADAAALIEFLNAADVDVLDCTPTQLDALLATGLLERRQSDLTLLVGGEALTQQMWNCLAHADQIRAFNVYGPTECTVDATVTEITTEQTQPVIGKPIDNARVYLLDAQRQLMPPGAVGELYIGGAGVSRGYLNRPELTAERFLDDPFVAGARMYRTGDLARYRADGNIEFLGRNDHQVKIRGFRIELGEIEAQIASHPAVREAVVIARARHEKTQDQQLVAYVTLASEIDANALREHLSSRLPDYMVPSAFVVLDALPLTPNGKLDRRALPDPQWQSLDEYVAPRTALEATLAQCFASVLDLERVSVFDNFFALGGHSLLATQLVSRLREALAIELPLRALFDAPSVASLAETLEESSRQVIALPSLQALPRPAHLPLSFAQERLWFLEQLNPGQSTYHIPIALRLRGTLDVPAFHAALNALVARHESLRTSFAQHDGQAVQRIAAELELALPLDALAPGTQADEVRRLAQDEARRPFDLQHGPLLRARLLRLAEEEHVLLFTMHHIVSDGWSSGVLVRELGACYTAALRNEPIALPPLAVQYADYTLWQRDWLAGAELERQTQYWRNQLAELAPLDLPTDRPRPAQISGRGATLPFTVNPALYERLNALANREGVTPFMLLLAVFQTLLARLSGQTEVAVGSPIANRTHAQIEPLIGLFVNTLVLRADLSGAPSLRDLLAQVRNTTLAAYAHQDLPFEKLVEALAPVRDTSRTPLFQVMFVLQNAPMEALALPGLTLELLPAAEAGAKFDLTLSLTHSQDGLAGTFSYATDLFDERTIARLGERFTSLLQQALDQPDAPLHAHELVLPEEHALLERWNDTAAAYPEHLCIHQLFEQQVQRTPDAIALVFEDASLTYAQLNARANRLAHHLIALGVRPEERVALCMERGIGMVVALMAILKAGGAYVPLDPTSVADRLGYMLDDAQVSLLITQPQLLERLPDVARNLPVVCPDIETNAIEARPDTQPAIEAHPQYPAYVIYTSGSTGQPKGVVLSHRNLANYLNGVLARMDVPMPGSMALASTIATDLGHTILFGALVAGHALHILSTERTSDGYLFGQYMRENNIGILKIVPGHLRALIDVMSDTSALPTQLLVLGGEATRSEWIMSVQALNPDLRILNHYGPTETTVGVLTHALSDTTTYGTSIPIGQPLANTRAYVLDEYLRALPIGVTGELYIGGAGLATGYLRRAALTAQRFVASPFVAGARMYRTGDLARYRADGNIEFLGRNDHQVKIRGFRIELGEIEAQLTDHPAVREAVVIARARQQDDQQLIAYVTPLADIDGNALREHLSARLPDYMVPSAFVVLDALPLTPNGKLDRRALPDPQADAFALRPFEAPQGQTETALADLWAELLGLERVGRQDNFFSLGGHSLLAVTLIERMRRVGLHASVRDLFATPVLSALAASLDRGTSTTDIVVPPNAITPERTAITPAMLPLIALTQSDIDRIVEHVPGGLANVQDIYALAPLQEGILFHHMLTTEGDPYLQTARLAFDSRARLDAWLDALQQVVKRHDILRTAFIYDALSTPAQVVLREAPVSLDEIELDPTHGPIAEQLAGLFDARSQRLSLTQAPLLRLTIAQEPGSGRWLALLVWHHLIGDHVTLEVIQKEISALLDGRGHSLGAAQPFRDLVAQARLGASQQAHEAFFRDMLADVSEPTLPFGLTNVHHDGSAVAEARVTLPASLNTRLRTQARSLGVSLASLCHLAWARVLSASSAIDSDGRIVFGTVLLGRMQAGVDQALGLLINTLPIRLDVNGTSVADSVRDTHERLAALLQHQHAPLALAQRCSGVTAPAPLFSALLNYRHNQASADDAQAFDGIELLGAEERTNYPLMLAVEDNGESLGLTAQTIALLSPTQLCGYMEQALSSLVQALEQAPRTPVNQLDVLPPEARTLLVETWNDTAATYPEHLCIHQLFEQQVQRSPDAIALVFEDTSLTYAQLNARANQLAHHLIALGVRPEDRVALCVERGIGMVVALLAILKAGSAYVPLDPAYPGERLSHILTDSTPRLLLADAAGREALGDTGSLTVLDPDASLDDTLPQDDPQTTVAPQHLAYVLFTSGSTGKPKGVMVEHREMLNFLCSMRDVTAMCADDTLLAVTTIAFDIAGLELYLPLSTGARVVLARRSDAADPLALQALLTKHDTTFMQATPATWRMLLDAQWSGNAQLTALCGGEALSAGLAARLGDKVKSLWNLYGPTETTVWSSCYHAGVEASVSSTVPVGRPIANTRMYLLDAQYRLVPPGAVGELYIGGAGVARGYLNRPDLTAERFIDDPFVAGARMYRTGDLARYRADGNIEFLGRNDHQVKIRGFRIELGEIEAQIASHAAVREAVVIARARQQDDQQLVAYVTAATEIDASALREHLAQRLPDYMVPSAFVVLDALPLTPNGKLDRRALPDPQWQSLDEYVAPRTALEDTLAQCFASVLGLERVSVFDNFFALGGHSLLATQLVSRLREALAIELPLRALFDAPSVASLAEALGESSQQVIALPPLQALPRPAHLPLSFAQERLWFLEQLNPGQSTYHIPIALRLSGALDVPAFHAALNALVARHESLRTSFAQHDGQAVQRIAAELELALPLDTLAPGTQAAEVRRLAQDEGRRPFDLQHGPLLRARLLRLAEEEHVLLFTMHHIVSDGWSSGVLVRELGACYTAALRNEPIALPPLAVQYADYTLWQRDWLAGAELERQTQYWRNQLAELAPLDLPTDRPRPAQISGRGATLPFAVNPALYERLNTLANREGVTPFMLLLAVFQTLLARLSGQTEVAVGSPIANRTHAQIEPLIGLFVNTLVLRADLSGAPSLRDLLAQVRNTTLAAYAHQDLPFEKLVEALAPVRDTSRTPLFQVMFVLQNAPMEALALPGLTLELLPAAEAGAKFDLTLSLTHSQDGLAGTFSYATDLFDERTITRLGERFTRLLQQALDQPDAPLHAHELVLPEEHALLERWNDTAAAYPEHLCIHQLFEQQVQRTPDAIALVFEDTSLTYAQVNARANQLAHHLIALGVCPEDRVALCMERGIDMVVALMAILKAGGAYVPLDPAYPGERLSHILTDATPRLLLADTAGREALGDTGSLTVLDPDASLDDALSQDDPQTAVTPHHLAYVIYTSGSTGKPKGVAIEHRNAVNFLTWSHEAFAPEELSQTLFATSLNFDLSIYECFAPLTRGGTIHLVDNVLALVRSPHDVSLINTVPSAITALLDASASLTSIRTINLAGEPLKLALMKRIFAETGIERLCNLYGPSETTTYSTWIEMKNGERLTETIGKPIANTRIYLLDAQREPVPLGTVGELYIGGAGVARGYLNRPELTAERFLDDPFVPGARMYRTGDLARYRADGNIEFLGRNDHQVKIRGFRIELGEIEAQLTDHPAVREAVVIARARQQDDQQLVAYVTPLADIDGNALREHLSARLPDYMVPSAFVVLDALPLTPNGKLDRRALPDPQADAFALRPFEAPQGQTETALVDLWAELLGLERVGRQDNFFSLGGHSLLAVTLIERMRRVGLHASVRDLFATPVLSALAASLDRGTSTTDIVVPPNAITPECTAITPAMLPLIALTQSDIDRIVEHVPGGLANVQDIYALAPLQEGILFHHMLTTEGDPYLQTARLAFDSRARLDAWLDALQQVVKRHDILRTAFIYDALSTPAQVVLREAPVSLDEIELDPTHGPIAEQLAGLFDARSQRLSLTRAPLLRLTIAQEPASGRWLALLVWHHLIGDHVTLEVIQKEISALLDGRGHSLGAAQPFRDLVAQARLGASQQAHEAFFRDMLADVSEPTLPFGLTNVHHDGSAVAEARVTLPASLNTRLRTQARSLGVSLASLCHLAWARVLSASSAIDSDGRIVFGTVLLGRMQAGVDQALGLLINTLPIRLDVNGTSVADSVRDTHERLAALLQHQHAPLALAQRCSGVTAPAPLFSALLNYRHNQASADDAQAFDGIELLGAEERTNYPLMLAVEDNGESLGLTAQTIALLSPTQLCGYMEQALSSLVQALEQAPRTPVNQLDVLPPEARTLLVETWNDTAATYPEHLCIHQLFEQQVQRSPDAIALVFEDTSLTYAQLNARANQLAHHLIALGVRPEDRVALCVERGIGMVVALLAILKAGSAYVPLDPAYPGERLSHILTDSTPRLLLADAAGREALGDTGSLTVLDPDASLDDTLPQDDPQTAVAPQHLAYVLFTSGSTGKPKGVMVEHREMLNFLCSMRDVTAMRADDTLLAVTTIAFDIAGLELYLPLSTGARVVLARRSDAADPLALQALLTKHDVSFMQATPATWRMLLDAQWTGNAQLTALCGGEALSAGLAARLGDKVKSLWNLYGPTETTVWSSCYQAGVEASVSSTVPVGRPIANTRMYLLDAQYRLVPPGAVGELYIGGAGVARGYLNRPDLTAERFIDDPFVAGARMYRTGDLARYRADGNIEFLGRNDHQVKIRGFRIELGEIEAQIASHAAVREAVVIARARQQDDQQLVAYVTAATEIDASALREHLAQRLPDYMVPSAFVVLDALPLTPNGKLDRRALPDPQWQSLDEYVAPRTALEDTLAQCFASVLGLERVSVFDNFFALGGHSLLAVQLTAHIDAKLGQNISIRELFKAPSVAELADRLNTTPSNTEFDTILPIRAPGEGAPLFCIHPVGGLAWSYAGFAKSLEGNQPIYAIQTPALQQPDYSPATIEEMASDYIARIRSIQPHGPYRLLGWSFGGLVAYEMATQLQSLGETIDQLVLLDSRLSDGRQTHGVDECTLMAAAFPGMSDELTIALRDMRTTAERVDALRANRLIPAYITDRHVMTLIDATQQNMHLQAMFAPKRYGGDIVYFTAARSEKPGQPRHAAEWREWTDGSIVNVDMDCAHADMCQPSSLVTIGQQLASLNVFEESKVAND